MSMTNNTHTHTHTPVIFSSKATHLPSKTVPNAICFEAPSYVGFNFKSQTGHEMSNHHCCSRCPDKSVTIFKANLRLQEVNLNLLHVYSKLSHREKKIKLKIKNLVVTTWRNSPQEEILSHMYPTFLFLMKPWKIRLPTQL